MKLSTLTLRSLSFHLHRPDEAHGMAEGTAKQGSIHGGEPLSVTESCGVPVDSASVGVDNECPQRELPDPRPALRRETRSHKPVQPSCEAHGSPRQEKEEDPSRRAVDRPPASSSRAPPARVDSGLSRSSRGSATHGTSRLAVVRRTSSGTLAKVHHASSGSSLGHAPNGGSSHRRRAPPRRLSSDTLDSAVSSLGSAPASDDERKPVEREHCHQPEPSMGHDSGGSAHSRTADERRRPYEGRRPSRRPPSRTASWTSHRDSVADPKAPERGEEKAVTAPTVPTKTTATAVPQKPIPPMPDRVGRARRSTPSAAQHPPPARDPRKKLAPAHGSGPSLRSLVADAAASGGGPDASSSSLSSSVPRAFRGPGAPSAAASGHSLLLTQASLHQSVRDILAGLDDLDSTLHGEDSESAVPGTAQGGSTSTSGRRRGVLRTTSGTRTDGGSSARTETE